MTLGTQLSEGAVVGPSEGFRQRLQKVVDGYGPVLRLAKATGMSEAVIRKWLKGESVPTADRVMKICAATGANPQWLMEGKGPPASQGARQAVSEYRAGIDEQLLRAVIESLELECARLRIDFASWSAGKRAAAIAEVYDRSVVEGAVHQTAVSRVVKLGQ